jgi:hypothetical protein
MQHAVIDDDSGALLDTSPRQRRRDPRAVFEPLTTAVVECGRITS